MYRSIKALKDSYITDRIIRSQRQTGSNVGLAGTMDLFKIYGYNKSGSTSLNELSRLLVQFDLTALRADLVAGMFDIAASTFKATLRLHDVYGGQTTPRDFTLKAYPLSRSWTEGRGRDVVFYQDQDNVNFLTATYTSGAPSLWFASGANAKGLLGSADIDLIASGNLGAGVVTLSSTQSFVDGTEDLDVDVTRVVSATLANLLPDQGFRISFAESQEDDTKTRFVKRFGSRHAIDPDKRPELIVKYDDSRISHQSSFVMDASGTLFLNHYIRGIPTNLVSGSTLTPITGTNCALVKLWTVYSGTSEFAQYATASQHRVGTTFVTGVYSATFAIRSNETNLVSLVRLAASSGSSGRVTFNEIWTSLDGSVAFHSATLRVALSDTTVGTSRPRRYDVNVPNVSSEYASTDVARLRMHVFDRLNPSYRSVKIPVEEPSLTLEAYYSVRDVATNEATIPFDTTNNSTRMSSDGTYLYFDVWMDALVEGRSYAIDAMLLDGGQREIYYDASPAFRVVP